MVSLASDDLSDIVQLDDVIQSTEEMARNSKYLSMLIMGSPFKVVSLW